MCESKDYFRKTPFFVLKLLVLMLFCCFCGGWGLFCMALRFRGFVKCEHPHSIEALAHRVKHGMTCATAWIGRGCIRLVLNQVQDDDGSSPGRHVRLPGLFRKAAFCFPEGGLLRGEKRPFAG